MQNMGKGEWGNETVYIGFWEMSMLLGDVWVESHTWVGYPRARLHYALITLKY